MNDSSIVTSGTATAERWSEMATLMAALIIRAFGVGIAAGGLALLTASVLA